MAILKPVTKSQLEESIKKEDKEAEEVDVELFKENVHVKGFQAGFLKKYFKDGQIFGQIRFD